MGRPATIMVMQLNMTKFAIAGVKVVAGMIAHHATWETADPKAFLADSPPPSALVSPLPGSAPPHSNTTAQPVTLASTSDTIEELRRRLGKELYRIELDLLGGGRINGKPCDCLSAKHHLGLEATSEELIPMDNKPVYYQIIHWLDQHKQSFEPQNILKHPPEYYQGLAQQVRAFRKDVMGSEKLTLLVSPEERAAVVARASEIVKQRMEVQNNGS